MVTKKSEKKNVSKKSTGAPFVNLANTSQPQNDGPEDWKVRIRMYRKWLGDCFLLTFRNGEDKRHIMIDCGVMYGTPGGKEKITKAVDKIVEETGGKLEALVVTHEHWDHVSGFVDAIESFSNFSHIGEVWAAWTEDPNQEIARENKNHIQLHFNAVQSALRNWNAFGSDEDLQRGSAVAALMEFMPAVGVAAFAKKSDEAMNNALSLGKKRLLDPGQTVTIKDIPGLRVHVLGPPKDIKLLHTMKGKIDVDMYGLGLVASRIACGEAFLAANARQMDPSNEDCYAPFENHLHWDEAEWTKQWGELAKAHNGEPLRKISRDWLNSAAELALQLDTYTNNTSLALAFELPESGDALLFVGDAQVGNWQSWADVKFSEPNVSAADLLSRAIFYKVGHHGSHNATLKQGGLEAMTSPNLVAAIPVDEEFARQPKGGCPDGWNMPAGPLLSSLLEKTSGRVLRGDSDFPENSAKPANMTDLEWQEFKDNTRVKEYFIDYFVR